MSKFKIALCLLGVVVLLSACASTTKTAPAVGIEFGGADALTRSEYVIFDTVEGNANSTKFLGGIIESTESGVRILGLGTSLKTAELHSPRGLYKIWPGGAATVTNRAYYDALSQVPDADTVLPMTNTVESWGLPPILWGTSATVSGKAIKLKSDKELK